METLHTNQIPVGGSNIPGALHMFIQTKGDADKGILLTDGGETNTTGTTYNEKLNIAIIGIGSEK